MKSLKTILSLAALLGMAACAGNTSRPTDTGNMAFPAPVPAGNVGSVRPGTLDTGSMNQPMINGGVSGPGTVGSDTGSMALPPRAQGNSLPK